MGKRAIREIILLNIDRALHISMNPAMVGKSPRFGKRKTKTLSLA